MADCQLCSLGKTRKNLVFGDGNPQAKIVFVGEAPGADEDEQGKPFVGRAGQLLTKILEAIKLSREEVFIANILKCRPPNNRDPLPEEISACWPWLEKQINIIDPQIIVTLGRHSLNRFFPDFKISAAHGKILHKKFLSVGRLKGHSGNWSVRS
ncbi:MAG: uracil-DNA glycosylase [Syntrophaceae bacterium]|nr:uracil-DNA glycosylase [Syntrophaceae bacterium]